MKAASNESYVDFEFSEARLRSEYEATYSSLSELLSAHGQQLMGCAEGALVFAFPRSLLDAWGYPPTVAVTVSCESAEAGSVIAIRTLELGEEGARTEDYDLLVDQALYAPEWGAWYWRETRLFADVDVWNASIELFQVVNTSRIVSSRTRYEARRRKQMHGQYEEFKKTFGLLRIDREMDRLQQMAMPFIGGEHLG